jgi:hypothetical protein
MGWSNYQSTDIVNRRAGGRRRVNAERKARAWKRREEIKELIGGRYILLGTSFARGLETKLAEYFGVNRSTICRDKEALLAEWRKDHVCPGCGTAYGISLKALARVAKRGIDVGCSALGCSLKNSACA